jgi:S1-C subfamily serine protease
MTRAGALLAAALLLAPLVAAGPPRARVEVVAVSVARATGPPDAATGFIAGDGRVVTVAHVLQGAGAVTVRGEDGVARRAAVLRSDRRLDLAVLAVSGVRGEAPAVAAGAGEARVVTPAGVRRARVVRPIVARLDGVARPGLELRAHVAVGDSGAPVVTSDGGLAGVVFARSRGRAGTAYAVDAAALPGVLGR